MRRNSVVAAGMLAAALPMAAVGQNILPVPVGGAKPAPVPQAPPADPKDTPEQIAQDAARDLTPTRFYNRPGATRAEYDAAWQDCRLIARGSRTPSGSVPYYYNPAVISPLAAGIGGGIGGAIGSAIAEGQQRRANRQSCLLIRGWRLVEPSAEEAAPVLAMPDAARQVYLDRQIGAAEVKGRITARSVFAQPRDAALRLDAPLPGPGSVWLGAHADPAAPFVLAPGEAAVVLAFRRTDAGSAGRSAKLNLVRYDVAAHDLIYRPRDWKKVGDKTTYSVAAWSSNKQSPYELQVLRVTPGDYVLDSSAVGALVPVNGNCFGAPTFHVDAGEIGYLGDFMPEWNVKLSTADRVTALIYAGQSADAGATLAKQHPELAGVMKPVQWRNRATYACSAIVMNRLDLPDVDALPDPAARE